MFALAGEQDSVTFTFLSRLGSLEGLNRAYHLASECLSITQEKLGSVTHVRNTLLPTHHDLILISGII